MPARPREGRAEVTAVRWLTPQVIEADLRVDEPADFTFAAGQWISVPFGPKTVRAWSMASPPTRPRALTLCVDVSPGGIGSQWFAALEVGTRVRFKGPTGGFVYDRADPRRPIFVAEEVGVVPIRSILTELDETGHDRPAALVNWARDPGWLLYDDEFRALARRASWFTYFPAVREAPVAWRGDRGEAHEVVDRLVHSVEHVVAYVCGGGAAVNEVRNALVRKGMDRKTVKWEKFW